jgi:hypothetical protein
MLKTVAENVIEVLEAFSVNVAVPEGTGRGPPVLSVGIVGGFSCELVRFAEKVVWAWAFAPLIRTTKGAIKHACSRSMGITFLSERKKIEQHRNFTSFPP